MAWLRIDDRVRTHPKVVKAGPSAAWLWFCGICYCREHLTDGLIPKLMVNTLAPGLKSTKACTARLVEVGLWHDRDDSIEVHDFLEWNPTRAEVEEGREKEREKKRRQRDVSPENPRDVPEGQLEGITRDPHARSRDRAGDAGLGLGSSRDLPVHSQDPEGGPGETRLAPRRGRGPLIESPIAWDRRHGGHLTGFCDWVCLPEDLLAQFANRLPGIAPPEARAQVVAWAQSVRDTWQAEARIPAERPYDFWNFRWEEAHGSSKPRQTAAPFDPLAGLKEAMRHV